MKLKKTVTLLLALTTLFSVASCKKDSSDNDQSSSAVDSNSSSTTVNTPIFEDTDYVLASNKSSEYKIVLPEAEMNGGLKTAANELNYFMKSATGATFSVVSDATVTSGDSAKIISIGATKALENSGLDTNVDQLKKTGYRIVTKADDVYIWGPTDRASLYGVYEFLEHEIGFEVYARDEIAYTPTDTLKLKDFDLVDNPSFDYSSGGQGCIWFGSYRDRLRHGSDGGIRSGPGGASHNTTTKYGWLPKEEYMADHPKWYATSDTDGRINLCYNARGDEAEFALMFETFMTKFIDFVLSHPEVEIFAITQQDVCPWCSCAACKADIEKYGAACSSQIIFCNKVSDAAKEYFEENGIDREFKITFFAYATTIQAPVKEVNGEWVPTAPEVVCRDNVYPWYAVMSANQTKSFLDPVNTTAKVGLEQWGALANTIDVWLYSANFNDYFQPYDCFGAIQETYQYVSTFNPTIIQECGKWNEKGTGVGWRALLEYVQAKLFWNVNEDFDTLVTNFFKNYYKDAAEEMLDVFNTYRAFSRYQLDVLGMPSGLYADVTNTKYWPKGALDTILGKIDEAYKAIESLKESNYNLYTTLYNRICTESLSYRKYDLVLYASSYQSSVATALKNQFKADCDRLNVTLSWEGGNISELYQKMGIA